ncbi:MAG: hypothetical protein PHI60_08905 [Candidatus Omnitrophica bacterium]|nr:hypothetical protein [Candidatus Omnitrophota bacterium]
MFDIKLNTKALKKLSSVMENGDIYLRRELADGLDHASRRFFKRLWEERLQGRPGIKAYPFGVFDHFWRSPKGVIGDRSFRAKSRASTVQAFLQSAKRTADMGIEMFSDSSVAAIHEEGRTLRGKDGKLAVPMPPNIQPKMYDSLGRVKNKYKKPENLDLERVTLKGQQYLIKKYKRKKKLNVLYVLKNEVYVKKRLGYEDLFERMKPEIEEILAKSFYKGLQKFREA